MDLDRITVDLDIITGDNGINSDGRHLIMSDIMDLHTTQYGG